MIISVFAIDPGTTTGWAAAEAFDTRMHPTDWPWMTGQMMGEEHQQAVDLYNIAKVLSPCAIVIEDFVPQRLDKARWFLSPIRVASYLTMLLWQDKLRWEMQMPSLAMTTVREGYLQQNGLWVKGQTHAMDATRHAITFVRRVINHPELYAHAISPRGLENVTPI